MAKIGRNDRCPCGSGKKYKQCCLAKDEAAERNTFLAAPAADHLPHHHPRLCKDCNAEIDAAANAVIALIDAGKLDDAEHAAQALVERWPDVHDGYDCLGMVHQVRGESQAAEYYRKVVAFAREEPESLRSRVPGVFPGPDRTPRSYARAHGGSAPKPPGYLKPNDAKVRMAPRYRRGRR